MGTPGRVYVELAASWLDAIALAGMVVWWGDAKRRKASHRTQSPRDQIRRHHDCWGTWFLPGFLLLTVTNFGGRSSPVFVMRQGWDRRERTSIGSSRSQPSP
ncbi:PepSY domain-containing protein [Corynebacterium sp. SCR221107]|uniref:PepSY domain-containing protein n=1 Tax=Corynebacterium sp. SCR221107 TaxID=3017361 RepID=UPI003FA4154B